jgi:hypothetical protein
MLCTCAEFCSREQNSAHEQKFCSCEQILLNFAHVHFNMQIRWICSYALMCKLWAFYLICMLNCTCASCVSSHMSSSCAFYEWILVRETWYQAFSIEILTISFPTKQTFIIQLSHQDINKQTEEVFCIIPWMAHKFDKFYVHFTAKKQVGFEYVQLM